MAPGDAFTINPAVTLDPGKGACLFLSHHPPMVNSIHSPAAGALGLESAPNVPKQAKHSGPGQDLPIVDFSRAQIAALFVVFAGIAAIPILLHPLPPLSDYINHLSRMHVIAAIGGDPDLARFYEIDWQLIPNLMMDMIVPLLVRFMSIYAAGQAYTVASFILILSGTFVLNRQLHGRWSVLPLAAFPLLYNFVFLVGTMNYVFGVGLSLWALSAWIALRERNLVLRLALSTVFVVALFLCHLFALGTYGLGLLAFELHRLWLVWPRRRASVRALSAVLFDFVATGLPFLPVLPLLMMSPTWGLRGSVSWEWPGKLDGVIFALDVYSDVVAGLLAAAVVVVAAMAVRQRMLRFHAFGGVLLAVGAIVYLAMPRIIFDTYMADQRLPVPLAFMVVACAQLDLRTALARRGFVAVMVLLLGARVLEVQTTWAELAPGIAAFRQSVDLVDRGAKVLVAYADPEGGDDIRNLGLVHAACIAIIERSALVTTVFSVVGKQVLHVRADYRDRVDIQDGSPPGVDSLIRVADFADPKAAEFKAEESRAEESRAEQYWARWTSDYDFVYVLFTAPGYENPDPVHLTPVFSGEKFALFRIEHSQIADAGKTEK